MFNCHRPRPCNKPQVLQTQVCPTQQAVRETDCNYVVPVVHPRHTTNVVNHRYDFYHSFPQTESTVNRITNRQFQAGPGGAPGQVAGAFQPGPGGAPGQVAGAFQPGPGGAPGQVAGAFQPGPGGAYPNQVAGAFQPNQKPCSSRRGFFG
ncbi:spore coat protein [Salipaludibacillus sp. HK11]|uniref:spore coat protein n=1 Tax=Salipaludibacillus sp. HK11 TaxID=3394320 RepID=UPI0039FDA884